MCAVRQRDRDLALHGRASGTTVLFIGLLAMTTLLSLSRRGTVEETIEIGIEHAFPLALSLTISMDRGEGGIAEFSHDGEEIVQVSVPSSWHRREVRGVTLEEVPQDTPAFGFRRWHIPARAVLSFTIPASPSSLLIHNPSGAPLKIGLKRISIERGEVLQDVILVKDTPVRLW